MRRPYRPIQRRDAGGVGPRRFTGPISTVEMRTVFAMRVRCATDTGLNWAVGLSRATHASPQPAHPKA